MKTLHTHFFAVAIIALFFSFSQHIKKQTVHEQNEGQGEK